MKRLVLIVHNVRSAHNVGSIFRTSDGLGLDKIYLTGYTPYPIEDQDSRLPYIAERAHRAIAKTALGAENTVKWQHEPDIVTVTKHLKKNGFFISALEQTKTSIYLPEFVPPTKLALILGSEIGGIEPAVLKLVDMAVEIPMQGNKESFNVAVAAGIALYHCRFH